MDRDVRGGTSALSSDTASLLDPTGLELSIDDDDVVTVQVAAGLLGGRGLGPLRAAEKERRDEGCEKACEKA